MASDLDGDVIESVDGADTPVAEPSLRDTVREAYDKARESEGEQTGNEAAKPSKGRTADGRFTPSKTQEASDAARVAQGGPQTAHPSQNPAQAQTPAQPAPTGLQPPVGWTAEAKAAFAALPPAVQQAVAAREEQVNNGFRILQNYKGLEQFQPYIDKSGVSYHEVFDRAVKWEQATLTDPIGTIRHLANIRGISPALLVRALQDPNVANSIRMQSAQRQGQPQSQQAPALTAEQARQLAREEYQRARMEDGVNNDVSTFLNDPAHPHAEALADDMVMLINANRAETLKDAYQMALRMHPELPQAVNRPAQDIRQRQQAVSNAKAAAKAVTGSPVSSAAAPKSQNENQSLRDTIRAAYREQVGRVDD